MGERLVDLASGPGNLGPGLKVGWAKHHLRALDVEMRKFLDGHAYTITTEDDLETGEHILNFDIADFDVSIGLIAGDFVSCLRGSLDHLSYQLTLVKGGVRNERASFPVVDMMNSEQRKMFNRAVTGIPAAAVAVIDSLQPYHSGQAYKVNKLWRLHRLWNIDKHRRIPFHGTAGKVNIICPADVMPIMSGTKNGSKARFPISAKGQVYFEPPVKISVEFGDVNEGIVVPYDELIEIHNFIRNDVMPSFKSFF